MVAKSWDLTPRFSPMNLPSLTPWQTRQINRCFSLGEKVAKFIKWSHLPQTLPHLPPWFFWQERCSDICSPNTVTARLLSCLPQKRLSFEKLKFTREYDWIRNCLYFLVSKGIWADCEEIDSQMIKRDNPPDAKRFRIIHSNMRLLVTALTAAAGQTANESKR